MKQIGDLYIVATPIGNLEDLTFRAARILKDTASVFCEDTRVTKNLLTHIGSSARTFSLHAHSNETTYLNALNILLSGEDICYLTDAGTPGISDPGNELVSFIRENAPNVKIIPLAGASALTSIASVSGFDLRQFVFSGFAPKKKTEKYFKNLIELSIPFVFYDSPFRIVKNLDTIIRLGGGALDCVVGRELTKKFETLYFGPIAKVQENLLSLGRIKGEIVVIVNTSKASIEATH
jgi:16S rRNA (cytidine1402-2'-O)-methyltransferase